MAPRTFSRRRTSLFSLLFFIFLFANSAAAAVLGIDLGTEYIKTVIVKPGSPLEIVLAKDSKRKEPAILAFKPPRGYKAVPQGSYPERFYGSAAQALSARIPGDVYPNLKQLLGQPFGASNILDIYQERYPGLKAVRANPRDTIGFQSQSFEYEERAFSVEELLGMVLINVKENALITAGKSQKIDGVVFTVPPYFTTQEKAALELAADMARLGVMTTVSDGVAVGTHYATSRTFPDISEGGKPEIHMVFDVGAGYTSATVMKMQGRTIKDVGRFNKTIQEVIPLGSGWDRTLGGDALNQLIVKDMTETFVKTPAGEKLGVTAEEVRKNPRAAARLWKDAERLRQVLSANQETSATFEDLYSDTDFKYKLSRSRFEELAETGGISERLSTPFANALKQANLTVADLDSIILHGGATRTPFVLKHLETLARDVTKLKSNVNADEAAAFGAAFKAARLSPSFRVKDVRDYNMAAYPTWMQYQKDGKDGKEGKTQQQKIFQPTSFTQASKTLRVPKYEDFELYLFQTRPTDAGSPFERSESGITKIGSRYQSKNLTHTVESMINDYGCKKQNITTEVTVTLELQYGLPELVGAVVTCEVEPPEKKGVMDGVKDFLGFGKGEKEGQQVLKDESAQESTTSTTSTETESSSATDSSATSTVSEKADKKSKKSKKTKAKEDSNKAKKDVHKIKIEFDASHDDSLVVPFAEQKFIQERIRSFAASDATRHEREEDLNNLEGLAYKIRDLITDEDFQHYTQSKTIKEVEDFVKSTLTWLNDEGGSNAESPILKSKHKQLKGLVDPIQNRRVEAQKRPELTTSLQDALSQAKSMIDLVKETIKTTEAQNRDMEARAKVEADLASSSSAAAAAAAAESSSTDSANAPSATDPLADLEEEITSTTSSVEEKATILPVPAVSPYTEEDLQDLNDAYGRVSEWLEDRLALQAGRKPHEDPAFKAEELQKKAKDLNDAVMEVLTKSMKGSSKGKKGGSKTKKAEKTKSKTTADDAPTNFMAGVKKPPNAHEEL